MSDSPFAIAGPISYTPGYRYQLDEDWTIQTTITGHTAEVEFATLFADGRLQIRKGFAWDGASGPTIPTSDTMRASLVHDALYRMGRAGLLPQVCKDPADCLLRDLMLADGAPHFRAEYFYQAVRELGEASWRVQPRDVRRAP